MSQLRFTIIQSTLHWEDKEANLDMFEQKISGITEKTEVVLLPEMFSTGFTMNAAALAETMQGPTVQWMKAMAARHKIILAGSIIIKEFEQNKKEIFYNRLVWMLPNGQLGFYDKRHLFAYAGEDVIYSPGKRRLIASVKGWKIHLQICYDLRFPVWARQMPSALEKEPMPEYDVLINVANWPQQRSHAWKTLLQARAIENQCYAIGVNRVGADGKGVKYSGNSLVAGPLGEMICLKENGEDIFTVTLEKQILNNARQQYPFLKDADRFIIINE